MTIKSIALAGATFLSLAAPAAALADPAWNQGGDYQHDGGYRGARDNGGQRDDQRQDGRDHEGQDSGGFHRDNQRDGASYYRQAGGGDDDGDRRGYALGRERDFGWGRGYGWHNNDQRCSYETRGHYTWFGEYVEREVRVCR